MYTAWFAKFVAFFAVTFVVFHGCHGTKYLACYKETTGRLLRGAREEFPRFLSQEHCVTFCKTKGMRYFGLKASKECYCSVERPPSKFVTEEDECNSKCKGNPGETCGGENTLSVYDSEIVLSTVKYMGCYKEKSGTARLMYGKKEDFRGNLTSKVCTSFCRANGFLYAGTQYTYECFCSNERPHFKYAAAESDCSAKCDGDPEEMCGGNLRLSVYDLYDKSTDFVYSNFLGCYELASYQNEFERSTQDNFKELLTPEFCVGHCYRRGYRYAGMESGSSCYCSKVLGLNKVNDVQCDTPCAADAKFKCGGNRKLSVYHTEISDQSEDGRLIGCFEDNGSLRVLSGLHTSFAETNTPRLCLNVCLQLGFKYAGVQYREECFCGNRPPAADAERPESDCSASCPGDRSKMCGGTWRLLIFSTGSDTVSKPAVLIAPRPLSTARPFTTRKPTPNRVEPEIVRTVPTRKPQTAQTVRPIPTYHPQTSKPMSNNKTVVESSRVTPTEPTITTQANKMTTSPKWSDVKTQPPKLITTTKNQPSQTFTTWKPPSESQTSSWERPDKKPVVSNKIPQTPQYPTSSESTNYIAPGDHVESGQHGFQRPGSHESRPNEAVSLQGSGATTSTPNCQRSATRVKGESTCKGQIIFQDDFSQRSSSIDQYKWTHEVIMPYSPDYEFVVYRKEQQNLFLRNQKLFIKPTLYDNEFVKRGDLNLESCTGIQHSQECYRQAVSYNIIPPVQSARITTKDTMTFKFGRIDIRAKLPLGDWLVPEIWLEPKMRDYGTGAYASGRVRIAMARGNQNLELDGKDIGNRQLEGGVLLGTNGNIRARTIIRDKENGWWKTFHNYTLIWTPDDLRFLIDGQHERSLVNPGQKLYQLAGFDDVEGETWSEGSSIAPFDKEFYITLGLSVGGMREFPDFCRSSGHEKPWKNSAVKAMVSFWEDRQNWYSTWRGEDSSLQIERVTVTAV